MVDLVLTSRMQFEQYAKEADTLQTLLRLNNALCTGTLFLSYTVVEEGRECFTWNIDGTHNAGSFSFVQWVPPVAHPLNADQRNLILGGSGAGIVIPRFLHALLNHDTEIDISEYGLTIAGDGFGFLEIRR